MDMIDVTVAGLNSAANELIVKAKELSKRVHEAVESDNFGLAVILLSDMSIAANRADAALLVLKAIEEEEVTELDKEAAERLLARLQRDSRTTMNKENSPSFHNVIRYFQSVLTSVLEGIESAAEKG